MPTGPGNGPRELRAVLARCLACLSGYVHFGLALHKYSGTKVPTQRSARLRTPAYFFIARYRLLTAYATCVGSPSGETILVA